MNVFCYVRVSTENQLENYSIDEQTKRLKAYCLSKGWTVLKVYTDGGYSGGNLNRPALNMMLQDLRAGLAQVVVVYKLDRLSRSQKDTLTLIEDEFLANHVDFVSISENFDTSSPFGRAMIGILSVFAQLEKDQIVERFTMGRIGRSKAGYFHGGGNPPRGYQYIDGKLVVDEYEATLVREVYRCFLEGATINAIYQSLWSRGIHWSATAVRNTLRNSLYMGKIKFKGQEYDGLHTPIISPEMYHSVQALLNSPEREQKKTTPQKTPFRAGYLLSSLIFCQRCGAKYSANHGYYRCYSRAKSSKKFIRDPNCKNDHWEIQKLDQYIIDVIKNLIYDDDLLEQVLNSSQEKEPEINTKAIEKQISEIDKQISRMIELYQLGTIPIEEISKRTQELNRKKEVLYQQLTKKPNNKNGRESFLHNIQLFKEQFSDSPLEQKRLLISSVIESIWLDGDQVSIHWRMDS